MTSSFQVQEYPRLLFSIRVHEDVKPYELSTEMFVDWLRSVPVSASFVRVEAGFTSDSTLLMVSMPASILGYLRNDPSITLLGTIYSRNLLTPKPSEIKVATEELLQSSDRSSFTFGKAESQAAASLFGGMTQQWMMPPWPEDLWSCKDRNTGPLHPVPQQHFKSPNFSYGSNPIGDDSVTSETEAKQANEPTANTDTVSFARWYSGVPPGTAVDLGVLINANQSLNLESGRTPKQQEKEKAKKNGPANRNVTDASLTDLKFPNISTLHSRTQRTHYPNLAQDYPFYIFIIDENVVCQMVLIKTLTKLGYHRQFSFIYIQTKCRKKQDPNSVLCRYLGATDRWY